MSNLIKLTLAAAGLALLVGCSRPHSHEAGGGHGHVHTPPHGGTAIELGDHAYQLEFVHDPVAGSLTLYVLDGHMQNFVRLAVAQIDLQVDAGNQQHQLQLEAAANPLTGEQPGNTAMFVAQTDWLRTTPAFSGLIPEITIRGQRFSRVAFQFPGPRHSH